MYINRRRSRFKPFPSFRIGYVISSLIALLFPCLLTYLMFYIQPFDIQNYAQIIEASSNDFILLNFIPVFLLSTFLFFATSNIVISSFVTSLFVLVPSFVNRFKILLRNDPFLPSDLTHFDEVFIIFRHFSSTFIAIMVSLLLLAIAFFVFCLLFFKTTKLNVYVRISLSLLIFVTAIFLNNTLYSDPNVYNRLYVFSSEYNRVENFNSKGFIYSFLYTYNTP